MSKLGIRFVKSHPALMATPVWADDAAFKLYHYLLYKANHKEQCWQGIRLHPNEVVISRQTAAAQLRWSVHKYQRHLQALEERGIIVTQRIGMGTKIKILDFLPSDDAALSKDEAQDTEPKRGYDSPTAEAMAAPERGYDSPTAEAMTAPERGYDSPTAEATAAPERGYDSPFGGATVAPNIDIYKNNNNYYNRDTAAAAHSSQAPPKEPEDFHRLWLAYPADRRFRRDEAARLYQAALQDGATPEAMLEALEADKRSEAWLTDGGKYIPGIVKWLQKEAWHNHLYTEQPKEDEEHWVSR